jgi:cyclic beta-1,2-glucan synthetase
MPLVHGYEGFDFAPPATIDEFSASFARWDAPDRALRRTHLRVELNQAIDGLRACVRQIEAFTDEQRSLSQAAQWLVDNFYIIERIQTQLSLQLADSALRGLPAYQNGQRQRRARVELLAHFYLEACDFDFESDELAKVLVEYQRVHPLQLRELALLSPVLNFLLIRQLNGCAEQILEMQRAAHWADATADAKLKPLVPMPNNRRAVEPELQRESDVFRQAYLGQMAQRHRYDDPAGLPSNAAAAATALKGGHASAIELDLVARTMLDVRVRNIFRSVKAIELSDWDELFSKASLVERALQRNAVYAQMDAPSKALYRQEIETLSGKSGLAEPDLAELVVDRFGHQRSDAGPSEDVDIGRALLSEGRPALERAINVPRSPWRRLATALPQSKLWIYVALASVLTLAIAAVTYRVGYPWADGAGPWSLPGLALAFLALWPASELGLHVVNRFSAQLFPPTRLPRLDFQKGLPADCKAMVVVPTLLTQIANVSRQVHELERHYLSNRDDHLRFALLTDWADAASETLPGDEALLACARQHVDDLNCRYPLPAGASENRFHVFHRARQWNDGEGVWMGWERKRGKLDEFNRLLLGESGTSHVFEGDGAQRVPKDVRYVITLDADTRMPVGTVWRLIGTAAHPLNRPQQDPSTGRVVSGFALFQPRISFLLPQAEERSVFRWIFSTGEGVDPYAGAISDTYQDVFGEATYTGKGLYDLRAFQSAMARRVPDNTLLSHDLFESAFARCALVSDVAFFEDSPSHSEVAAARSHRWVRGDWQLLPWLLWLRREPLSLLNRWKMLDNLRRSLLPIACFLLIVLAWSEMQAVPAVWIALVLASISFPGLLGWLGALRKPVPKGGRTNRPIQLTRDLGHVIGHTLIELVLLAQSACVMADAIARAVWRTFASRRKMLEWRTAAQTKAAAGGQLRQFTWAINSATLPVIASTAAVLAFHPQAFARAMPLLLAWWLAPIIAVAISSPKLLASRIASDTELREFRRIARRTWRFFEAYVGAADNHLPPDNVQFEPEEVVAHRTSPTNIGLYLLALARAYDMGWVAGSSYVSRMKATLDSVARLETYQGHLLNWYETRSLAPLEPRYVSSVDSGNLAAHLVVVSRSCGVLRRRPVVSPAVLQGTRDTWLELRDLWFAMRGTAARGNVTPAELDRAFDEIGSTLSEQPQTPAAYGICLTKALDQSLHLKELLDAYAFEENAKEGAVPMDRLVDDSEALCATLGEHITELLRHCPWAGEPAFEALRLQQPALFEGPLQAKFDAIPQVGEVPQLLADVDALLAQASADRSATPAQALAIAAALRACSEARSDSLAWLAQIDACCVQAEQLWRAMNFTFLFDAKRKLFSIGYRVNEHQLDEGRYDLLASESRLGSYLAAAKGDVPADHWFRLGRHMGLVPAGPVLISWSGSMFEYLMPALVMKTPGGSLLNQACRNAIAEQIRYGREQGVPWGISESGINVRDVELTYQYGPAGVPSLSLKRGMDHQLVIAPYATAMAAPFAPTAVHRNFAELAAVGALGPHGFFEAVDFTADRLGEGERSAVVKSHMTHHHAMSLLALTSLLTGDSLVDRFHSEPEMDAFDLLLQEQVAGSVVIARDTTIATDRADRAARHSAQRVRRFHGTERRRPAVHLLSNTRYAMAITATGAGYSECNDIDITRWREDRVLDESGLFIYLRDADSNALWSATLAPTFLDPDVYDVEFAEARVQFDQRLHSIRTSLEVVVAQQEDAEIRTIKLSNEGNSTRRIEVSALSEVVLNQRNADLAHPAFSNLFITTEYDAARGALLATRRPRASHEAATTVMLGVVTEGPQAGALAYDTDRRVVIGRGRTKREPLAFTPAGGLAMTVGAVLDPVLCLRQSVELKPGESARLSFVLAFGANREAAVRTFQRLSTFTALQREISRSWVYAQAKLHQLGISSDEAAAFQSLSAYLMFSDPTFRPGTEFMRGNQLSARALWRYGISGDRPILLITLDSNDDLPLVHQMLRAYQFWRARSFSVDIVILNDRATSYSDEMQHAIETLVHHAGAGNDAPPGAGRIYVLRGDRLPDDERRLLMTICRVYLRGGQGLLIDQLRRRAPPELQGPPTLPVRNMVETTGGKSANATDTSTLEFFNGLGGFAEDGKEYRIVLPPGRATPAPWVNVIASPQMGTLVSESGSAFTWRMNARENQLSPWSNDALSDPSSELVYIQDRQTGAYWTPTAQPRRVADAVYECAHGAGYSRYAVQADGIDSELTHFVAWDKPVKFMRLRLTNTGSRRRSLTLSGFVNLCLGDSRSGKVDLLSTWAGQGPKTTLYARNPSSADFGRDFAWMGCSHPVTGWTCDRAEFLGLGGSLAQPDMLEDPRPLRQAAGVGPDPSWVMQVGVRLEPGESEVVVFAFGQAGSAAGADELVRMATAAHASDAELALVQQRWSQLLDAVQVETPDRANDLMLNRWLLYQTISSRYLGRCGFYQAGGAYGFRDQLQDTMSLVHAWPQQVREHLIRAAGQQFVEGDVQHWWHPPSGKGVRTTFSDDRLFLPYAVAHYVSVTGDLDVLDQVVPFLEGPILPPDEESLYFEPTVAAERANLFEHCVRAIEVSKARGVHGLPLMGCGDWNDGMNRVGWKGKGESVWMAWFLKGVLDAFMPWAIRRNRTTLVAEWSLLSQELLTAIDAHAWDGEWYRRAYFDDGTPLGSASNDECRIDSLAQSWAVIAGGGDPIRAQQGMARVDEMLIDNEAKLMRLFTPSFDKTAQDPGYIKGYVPGIRENGGQYTHAAVWTVMAHARLGHAERASELFAMLNPVGKSDSRLSVQRYRVEPYVMPADIYGEAPHTGKGGWTWYTGAAGWYYRVGLEEILGVHVRERVLHLKPCIPAAWPFYRVEMKVGTSVYRIEVRNPNGRTSGIASLEFDGASVPVAAGITLADDGQVHSVVAVIQ